MTQIFRIVKKFEIIINYLWVFFYSLSASYNPILI